VRAFNFNDENGSAVIELLGFGILLQVPILMFATTMAELQRDQLAAQAISIQALRTHLQADNPQLAINSLEESIAEMSGNFGIPAGEVDYSLKTQLVDGVKMRSLQVVIGLARETSSMVVP
jgi:hypothetical protein